MSEHMNFTENDQHYRGDDELRPTMHDPTRDMLVEARMILKGLKLSPTVEHLEAVVESNECRLIKIANQLEQLKQSILKEG